MSKDEIIKKFETEGWNPWRDQYFIAARKKGSRSNKIEMAVPSGSPGRIVSGVARVDYPRLDELELWIMVRSELGIFAVEPIDWTPIYS